MQPDCLHAKVMSLSPRVVLQLLIVIVLFPLLPLLITRRWDWTEAWLYAGLAIAGFLVSRVLAASRHPDLLAERARSLEHENVEAWDRVLAPLVGLGGALIPLAAGLEALLGDPWDFGRPAKTFAFGFILAGYALASYAMVANRFFSGVVRIQTERGHRVVSSGPYRWIRHPGYTGALLAFLATPVLLDSVWAFVPALLVAAALVMRTRLEDQTLHARLEGYSEYARRVRYRLVPGLW